MEPIDPITIPNNIQKFLSSFCSVVEFSVNTTDCLNGYGIRIVKTCIVKMYREKCQRCGYDGLFNMEDKCERHSWSKGYESVFATTFRNTDDIEFSFDVFLNQPAFRIKDNEIERDGNFPVKRYSHYK